MLSASVSLHFAQLHLYRCMNLIDQAIVSDEITKANATELRSIIDELSGLSEELNNATYPKASGDAIATAKARMGRHEHCGSDDSYTAEH